MTSRRRIVFDTNTLVSAALEVVVLSATMINVAENISASRDPDDNKFIELATEARADAIVSGDQDLLVLHPYRGIPILRPADFLNLTEMWQPR